MVERLQLAFLKDNDQGLFRKLKGMAFDIQIACHELLGHGSGKLFMRRKDGSHNYDHGKVSQTLWFVCRMQP